MNELSLFRCLGEPIRFTVLRHLADGAERSVNELVKLTGQERTNVSHHLAQLRACGLVETRQYGKQILYRLAHASLAELIDLAARISQHVDGENPEACMLEGCC